MDVVVRELLACKDLYGHEPRNLAAYVLAKLKVLKGRVKPKDVAALLPPVQAALLRHSDEFIVDDPACPSDIGAPAEVIRPYWDPRLRSRHEDRRDLLLKLWLGFRRGIRARVGIFFVEKKNPQEIRM